MLLIQSDSSCSGTMGVALVETLGVEPGDMLEGWEDSLKYF